MSGPLMMRGALPAFQLRAQSSRQCSTSRTAPVASMKIVRRGRVGALSIRAAPQPDTETEGSPLDFPEEWVKANPSRRPDIFPEFKPMKPPLPQPMPGDPEQPDDEEEELLKKKKPGKPDEPDKKEDDPEEDPEKEKEKPDEQPQEE